MKFDIPYRVAADRWSYVPSLALAPGLAALLASLLARQPRRWLAALAVLLAASSALAWRQSLWWQDSATLWSRCAQQDPSSIDCTAAAAAVFNDQRRHAEAAAFARRGLAANGDAVTSLIEEVLALLALGEDARAREAARRLSGNAGVARGFLERGLRYHRAGQLDLAIAATRASLLADPQSAVAHHNLAVFLNAKGLLAQAAEEERAAVQLAPGMSNARYNLGVFLAALGRGREAAEQYRETIRLAPENGAAHANLGALLAAMGRAEEARPYCRKAQALAGLTNPNCPR